MTQTSFFDKTKKVLKAYLPILDWGSKYNSKTFSNDLIVALDSDNDAHTSVAGIRHTCRSAC